MPHHRLATVLYTTTLRHHKNVYTIDIITDTHTKPFSSIQVCNMQAQNTDLQVSAYFLLLWISAATPADHCYHLLTHSYSAVSSSTPAGMTDPPPTGLPCISVPQVHATFGRRPGARPLQHQGVHVAPPH